ncbi:hypothetical protein HHK36_033312 [Tetracentron sinense]|uniref:DUF7699 domain-containing protein n=1 Tax=Tetracentron sinense TaxID=13715 RepID=A0A835CYT8_TETSI|nr:hypothetical protein HHK36_033312 [Tetracentron sinense]
MQRVYEKFNKVTRNGNLIGKRTIAGRVVKESYGAAKQQHTFTVEILWSKGPKRLPPLSPLLVKGRNLYRLKTFRQRWNNETERSKVLAEKHKRGTAARHIRAMKESRSTNGGAECQRHSYHTRPPRKRRRHSETGHSTKPETMKCVNGRGKAPLQGQEKMKRVAKPRGPKSSPRHLRPTNPDKDGAPIHQSYTRNGPAHNHYRTQMQLHSRDIPLESHANSGPFQFEVGSTSAAIRAQPLRPYMNATAVPTLPTLRYQGYNHVHHAYSDSSYQFDRRNLNHFPNQVSIDKQLHPIPLGAEAYRPRNNGFLCSTPWCRDLGDESCVVSSCWRCCRKTGRRCLLHQFHSPF